MSKRRPQLSHDNGFVDLDLEEPIPKSRKTNGSKAASKTNGKMSNGSIPSSNESSFIGSQTQSSSPSSSQGSLSNLSQIRISDQHGFEMYVDKYKPKTSKDIVGQTGDRSNVAKLTNWLRSWDSNREKEKGDKKPAKRSNFGGGNDDGSSFKAVLLSGPPGIGKTTSAQLVCKELGFVYKELNASDTRSKKSLVEEASVLENKVLDGYFFKKRNPFETSSQSSKSSESMNSKHVLIMDEVDGMAGNEDRGGIAELIKLIKETKIPIICICNDRSHIKMRSLITHCLDLRFYRPRADEIKATLQRIADNEGIRLDHNAIGEIIASSNQDIRQSIHYLNMIGAQKASSSQTLSKNSIKDEKLGPFEAIKRVFPGGGFGEKKAETFPEKCDLFFHDYGMMPLMVFENYLKTSHPPGRSDVDKLRAIAEAADSMSFGDMIEKNIRTMNNWSQLPVQAAFSVAIPASIMKSSLQAMPLFPSYLGRLSNFNKRDRLLQELKCHMNLKISGTKSALSLDYLEPLRDGIINPLVKGNFNETVEFLNSYYLRKEDLDAIIELSSFVGDANPYSKLDSKTKAALTRAVNKSEQLLPYSLGEADISVKKGKGKGGKKGWKSSQNEEDIEDEDNEDEDLDTDVPNFE